MQAVSQWGSSMAPRFRGLIVPALRYLLVARQIIVLTLMRTAVDLCNKEKTAEWAAQWGCGRGPQQKNSPVLVPSPGRPCTPQQIALRQ